MSIRRTLGACALGALALISGFTWFLFSAARVERSAKIAAETPLAITVPEKGPQYSHGLFDRDFFDAAYRGAGDVAPTGARSAVVAHHLLVSREIARTISAIADAQVKTVIIVSPNHFHAGRSPAQVSRGSWATPYGTVESDLGAVARLIAADSVLLNWENVVQPPKPRLTLEESAFAGEHGIAALTPFIKRSFPVAKMIAITLDDSLPQGSAARIGERIAASFPDAVVIASMDMSHYLPAYIADAHDEMTLDILASGTRIFEDAETDSLPTLHVLMALNATRGTQEWHLTHHGSSLAMGASQIPQDNTSHILGYFLKGPPTAQWLGDPLYVASGETPGRFDSTGSPVIEPSPLGDTRTTNGYPAAGATRVFRGWVPAALAYSPGEVVIDPAFAPGNITLSTTYSFPERAMLHAEAVRVDYLFLPTEHGYAAHLIPLRETAEGASPLTDAEAQTVFTYLGIPHGVLTIDRHAD